MTMARTKAKPTARRPAARKQVAKSRAKPVRAAQTKRPATAAAVQPKRKPQIFRVSHSNEDDFEVGLRAYAKYRDLGMAKAHVIRFVPPCRPEDVSKLHYHDVEFQMVYVLKGWIKPSWKGRARM